MNTIIIVILVILIVYTIMYNTKESFIDGVPKIFKGINMQKYPKDADCSNIQLKNNIITADCSYYDNDKEIIKSMNLDYKYPCANGIILNYDENSSIPNLTCAMPDQHINDPFVKNCTNIDFRKTKKGDILSGDCLNKKNKSVKTQMTYKSNECIPFQQYIINENGKLVCKSPFT